MDYNQRTNEWSLIIQDVRPSDEGIYSCAISTKQETATYDIKLNVKSQYTSELLTSHSLPVKLSHFYIFNPCKFVKPPNEILSEMVLHIRDQSYIWISFPRDLS